MSPKPTVAVIGAGLGGLCAGIKLKEAGFNELVILEKGDKVGGTWRDNTYPGCACDTPVALYQFSFAPSLKWSHLFPRHHEVQQYTEDLADNFGLRSHLHLADETISAIWDDERAAWTLTTRQGKTYEAQVIIPALGQLNRPMLPAIEGRESFAGVSFHSARWNHRIDLTGKRVAVIGSAASAIQIIPEVAKIAGHLSVFQRTPNWILPRRDRPISDEEKLLIMTAPHVAVHNREDIYLWADYLFWQAFSWTEVGRAAFTRMALDHLHEQISDPALRQKLTPDYPIGCKRVLFADDIYPAFMRPNVSLETNAIVRITANGIETGDGAHHEVDVIVYATGFETTGWQWSLDVTGKNGAHLREAWAEIPEAYLGITTCGFPNMFMLYGPNTNLGHNAITFMIEQQAEYIVKALAAMQERNLVAIEVTKAAQDAFNRELQAALATTVWADPGAGSWYKTADGKITQNWSSHTRDYAKATAEINWDAFGVREQKTSAAG
ncbi:MAG: NAD(P)/FAD-dependent oxidoreductase [Acidobacteriota bacterium]